MGGRQIVHIDMDAFYASVEQRDRPELRGKPVVVAWLGSRSVVCAASYEARKFGIRSAMPALTAERLCPSAIFTPPDFSRYRAVSQQIRAIFARHTDLIEPLSLDEAYLDVTSIKSGLNSGLEVAEAIRLAVRQELNLTCSAGIAPNKFLAKIASDWRKPDGLFEVRPDMVHDFLMPLPVGKIPGVGKVTEERLGHLGIKTVGHVFALPLAVLESNFGTFGKRLFELARGIDDSSVTVDRPTQSISAEDTFGTDISLEETVPTILKLADRVWKESQEENRSPRTVVLKLKTKEFQQITRSHTPIHPPSTLDEFVEIANWLIAKVDLPDSTRYRLAGIGLSNFKDASLESFQPSLF